MFTGYRNGGLGRAAEVDRNVRLLQRADCRPRLLGLIKVIVDINGLFRSPDFSHRIQESIGTRVALVMVEVVTIPTLFGIVAAADDMHRQTPAEQMLQGSKLTCRQRRRDESRAMGQQKIDFLRR